MHDYEGLNGFIDLIQHHPVMRPPLFPYLADRAISATLNAEAYSLVATNIVAKTGLTLPRILTAAKEGALALEPTITAFTAITALEEAGGGKPASVHMHLMMQALNYHGEVAFGLPPVDYCELQELQILLDDAGRLLMFRMAMEGMDTGAVRNVEWISGLDGVEAATLNRARRCGLIDSARTELDFHDLRKIQAAAKDALAERRVLPEIIDYGREELYAQRTGRPGYIQGVTFAGEAVADDMLLSLFTVMYKDLQKYKGPTGQHNLPQDFEQNVLPYFAAHGEYLAIVRGEETVDERKTEVIHAQRELAKLCRLEPSQRAEALKAAQDFADRNLQVWNGILAELLVGDPRLSGIEPGLTRSDLLHLIERLERNAAFSDAQQNVVEVIAAALKQ